jgi:signal transduction histidine kinase
MIIDNLGILDGLSQIGTMVASLWLVFVAIRKPKQFFFFVSCIQSSILLLMIICLFIPQRLVHGFFIVLMLLLGMTKSVAFIPGIVLNQYFDWND